MMADALQDLVEMNQISQFLYKEARLQDEHRFAEWEALWTDDAIYWVPANGEDTDPEQQMSILYDNRSRIALRIRQYHTGKRFSQTPRSRLRRLVLNIEILEHDDTEVRVTSNAMVFESSTRGDILWASRNEYRLRRVEGGWRMALKKVVLVNNQTALFTMAFLI